MLRRGKTLSKQPPMPAPAPLTAPGSARGRAALRPGDSNRKLDDANAANLELARQLRALRDKIGGLGASDKPAVKLAEAKRVAASVRAALEDIGRKSTRS